MKQSVSAVMPVSISGVVCPTGGLNASLTGRNTMKNLIFSSRRWYGLLALLASALVFAAPALADPPGRIGRIALLSGTVDLYNPNTGEAFSAPLNQPLTSGDILTTDANSRSEIQIGSITVRLDAGSRLAFDRIDDEQVRLFLDSGQVIAKLSSSDAVNDFSMETRSGQFNARNTGIYRFDADASSSSGTAYYGALHFEASDRSVDIAAGQRAQFWQDGQSSGQTRYRLLTAFSDDFTRWSAARDQRPVSTAYSRYVSPEMTGAEDLDAYGNWSETSEYGAIWYPRNVAADWAPYRTGHWAWVEPWGWTWIGNEPWGFAPFHYGRWVQHHGRWAWVPGTRIARPVYAPAMVAWIGTPGLSISLSIGRAPAVGWFPLAPHEVFVPAYRSSANHVRGINMPHVPHIANVSNIVTNPQAVIQQTHYVHRDTPHAMTVVPTDVLTHHRPVAPAVLPSRDLRTLRNQPVTATAPVSAPQPRPLPAMHDGEERHSRPSPAAIRHEREPQAPIVTPPTMQPRVNTTPALTPSSATPVTAVQRNEQPRPEVLRPMPQSRSEPPTMPQTNTQFEPRNRPDRQDTALPTIQRRDREPREPQVTTQNTQSATVATPTITANRDVQNTTPPTRVSETAPAPVSRSAPAPQAPVVVPQRIERPVPEVVRPAPQARVETAEPRIQRPAQPREVRPEPAPQPVRQAPPVPVETRVAAPLHANTPAAAPVRAPAPPPAQVAQQVRQEAPHAVSRPPEPRPEAKPQRPEERQKPARDEQDTSRRQRPG